MTIGAVDKIKPLGSYKIVDAVDVEETADKQFSSSAERTKLAEIGSAARDLEGASSLIPTSGDLGELVFAFLDENGFFGSGLGKDGAWSAAKLRALTSVLTPLLSVAERGAIQMGSQSAVEFMGDGAIKGAHGTIDLRKSNYDWAICDDDNNVAIGWKDGKLYTPKAVTSFGNGTLATTYFDGTKLEVGDYNYDFCICDEHNDVLIGWMDGRFYGPAFSQSSTASFLDVQDAKNKTHTARVHSTRVDNVQRPTADYNMQVVYGQSLGQGDETWPALSRNNRFGNLMLGNSVQPMQGREVFDPVGGAAVLNPLQAITIDGNNMLYSDETAVQASGGARGEPINHGWANGSRFALAQHLFDEDFAQRRFVSVNVAWSGATIGELEKNHTEGPTEKYGRYTSALERTKIAAGTGSVVLTAVAWLQGEHDYYQATGHASLNISYTAYRGKLEKLIGDMQADAIATLGQALPPAFLMYQTSGAYTRDVDSNGAPGLHVGMAQLDVALASKTAWMVGPAYPYTDKGGHLDSNGSRWFGHQFAKVYEHVIIKGKGWEPLRPLRVWQETPGSNEVYVGYHVPVGPLAFDEPQLAAGTEYSGASKGFRLTDANGNISVINAEIVRDTIIKLTCSRAVGGSAKVWYASQGQTSPGNGMVRDSDPSLAIDNYVYEPERGMFATANIPQFVNKPYPLWNWGVAFYLPIGYEE